MPKEPVTEPLPAHELGNRTWEELEVVEDADGLLFKDEIRRRTAEGGWQVEPVRIRVPRKQQRLQARARARELFAKKFKLDEEKDAEAFEELEQFCLLALSIRAPKEPHPQLVDAEDLIAGYDTTVLEDVLGRIEIYQNMLEPRCTMLTPEQVWSKIEQVAVRGHLLPLTDIAGHERLSLITFMASQALLSPKAPSSARSSASSTPEPSPEPTSTES